MIKKLASYYVINCGTQKRKKDGKFRGFEERRENVSPSSVVFFEYSVKETENMYCIVLYAHTID